MTASRRRRHDVVIIGGGLAGLTLALQLKQSLRRPRRPGARAPRPSGAASRRTRSANRRSRSAPTTSTRCSASSRTCETAQLRKFGFRFFFAEGRRDIDAVTEIGASRYLSVPSYQIDRGIFENFLAEEAARRGVRFVDGATVRDIDAGRRRRRSTASPDRHDGVGHEVARALARRRLRPRRPAQAQARARRAERARRQRGVVPHRRAHRDRRLVRRPRLARALRRRRRAGSRPTTWSAPATGSG